MYAFCLLQSLLSLPLFSRYADAVLADTEVFQEKLVKEMNEMIEKHFDNESVPEVSLSDLFNKFISSPKAQIIIILQ